MKAIDNLRDRFARRQQASVTITGRPAVAQVTPSGKAVPEDRRSLAKRILAAPADFNRATRRSVGLFGRLWKWDVNGTDMQRTYVPRYVRRHHGRVMAHAANDETVAYSKQWSRRVRKERARIARIVRAKGLA